MKYRKDLPIYVLSASIVLFGLLTATQANSAPSTTPTLKQFQQLQKSVVKLQGELEDWSSTLVILQQDVEPLLAEYDSDSESISQKISAIETRLKSLDSFKSCGISNFTKLWIYSSGMSKTLGATTSCS